MWTRVRAERLTLAVLCSQFVPTEWTKTIDFFLPYVWLCVFIFIMSFSILAAGCCLSSCLVSIILAEDRLTKIEWNKGLWKKEKLSQLNDKQQQKQCTARDKHGKLFNSSEHAEHKWIFHHHHFCLILDWICFYSGTLMRPAIVTANYGWPSSTRAEKILPRRGTVLSNYFCCSVATAVVGIASPWKSNNIIPGYRSRACRLVMEA